MELSPCIAVNTMVLNSSTSQFGDDVLTKLRHTTLCVVPSRLSLRSVAFEGGGRETMSATVHIGSQKVR